MTIAVTLSDRVGAGFAINVAFEVPASGVTCLLGPSGSGKTTVLRAVAGLQRLNGTIRFGNEAWQGPGHFIPAHRRRIGYVFQGAGLLPHLTVAQNLAYAQKRAQARSYALEDVIARTGIGALLERRPAHLSGGESQRVSIARALLSQPRLLLMDEPLSALDVASKAELLAHFERLFSEIDLPVLYVTHDPGEAERVATRFIHLLNGAVYEGGAG